MEIEDKDLEPSLFVARQDVPPEIISNELLIRLIREQGYKGEAGRLCRDVPVDFKNVTVLKIEFQNILLIDHLWMLSNLKKLSLKNNKIDKIVNLDLLSNLLELDLSFNYIEKIENLDSLVKLEFLSLFGNRIRKLENLDCLMNMVRLSIGKNRIKTLENFQRLRFMKKLYSLNLEGNPVVTNFRTDVKFSSFVAAILPNLKYYNYKFLTVAEREEGSVIFGNELRSIQESEADEIEQREKSVRESEEEIRLSNCFVEFLNDHQLFDSMFTGDENATILLTVDGTATLIKGYRHQVYNSTQKIYNLGTEKHELRISNIAEFNESIEIGTREAQIQAIEVVNSFLACEKCNVDKMKELQALRTEECQKSTIDKDRITKLINEIVVQSDNYKALLDETWYTLMDLEMDLHERIDEANGAFEHNIQDMLYEFVENAQLYFVEITEAEAEFSDRLHELISNRLSQQSFGSNLHSELKKCLIDKDQLSNLVAASRDFRTQIIEKREESLIFRSRAWVTKLIEDNNLNERRRNRVKLGEIDDFINEHREYYSEYNENIDVFPITGDDSTN